jgi:hypothetical protein
MTDALDTPGAQLAPLDKVTQKRPGSPAKTGRAFGLCYAAWQVRARDLAYPYEMYVVDDSGSLIKGWRRKPHLGTYEEKDYHLLPSLAGLEDWCLRLHLLRRTGRCELSIDVVERPCPEVAKLLREARGREARRANRAYERDGSYMLGVDGKPIRV